MLSRVHSPAGEGRGSSGSGVGAKIELSEVPLNWRAWIQNSKEALLMTRVVQTPDLSLNDPAQAVVQPQWDMKQSSRLWAELFLKMEPAWMTPPTIVL